MNTTPIVPNLERRVRSTDPDTSWEAAASITPAALSDLQVWVLDTLTAHAMTDGELVDAHLHSDLTSKATPQRVRTARNELVLQGRVEWSGLCSLTQYSRTTQIWQARA